MYIFVVTFHIVLSVLLVLIILMQPGKGADVSSAFGGGASSQLFGAAGPGNFLTRGTGAIAALFMVTSITLALYSTEANMAGAVGTEAVEKLQGEGEEGAGFGVGGTPDEAPPADAPSVAPGPTGAPPADEPAQPEAPGPSAPDAPAPAGQ